MKKEYLNKAMKLSRDILEQLWNKEPDIARQYFADDIVGVGPFQGEFYHTKEQVIETVETLCDMIFVSEILNEELYPVANELHTCVIVSHFIVKTIRKENDINYMEQSVTFVWNLDKNNELSLTHVHYSSPAAQSRFFEVFSSAKKADQVAYVKTQNADDLVSIKDANKHIRIISLSNVEYAKAQGHDTIIYTHDEAIIAKISWKAFTALLDERFLKVHRSYVVQRECVKLIGKNYLEMHSGDQVPVPVKNMRPVVNALTHKKN